MDANHEDQWIVQSMLHLNELTQLDIEWLSETFHKIHSMVGHPVPLGLDFGLEDYTSIKELCHHQEGSHYCIASTIGQLEFVLIPLYYQQEKKGLIKIGPFLSNPMDEKKLSSIIIAQNMPIWSRQILRDYYLGLSLVQSHYPSNLGHIGMRIFGDKRIRPKMTNFQSNQPNAEPTMRSFAIDEQTVIERRYAYEKQLRRAITNGDSKHLLMTAELFENPPN